MEETLKAFWVLIRSRGRAAAFYGWLNFIGLMVASRGLPPLATAVNSIFSNVAAAMGVYVYNDTQDLESDEINPRNWNRPLVTGEASKREAYAIAIISSGIGFALSSLINLKFVLLILAFLILGFFYSVPRIHLQKRFFLKQTVLAVGTAISILAGGFAVENLSGPLLYASSLSLISAFGVSPIKDLIEMEGDEKMGKKTFPLMFGPKLSVRLALATVSAAAIASILGYAHIGFNTAFPILASIAFSAWIYVTYPLLKHWNRPDYVEKTLIKRILPIFLGFQVGVIFCVL